MRIHGKSEKKEVNDFDNYQSRESEWYVIWQTVILSLTNFLDKKIVL